MMQLIDVLTYLNKNQVTHRDLKLENIIVDDDFQLKVADFGFATNKNISSLMSYTGSKMYMAPEIEEGRIYDGH